MTGKRIQIFELVLVLSIAFGYSLIQSVFYIFTRQPINFTSVSSATYVNAIIQSLISITLMFYILFRNDKDYRCIGLNLKFKWNDLFIGIGLLLIAGFARGILTAILSIIQPETMKQALNPQNLGFLNTNTYGLLIIILILLPIQEELIVRGYTMSEIFRLTNSKYLAITISVLVQFTYHLYQGLTPAIMMLPYFIIASIYFVKTENLNPIIYSHVLTDLLWLVLKK